MADEIRTYQPHWDEKKKSHAKRHKHTANNAKKKTLFSSIRGKDKQAFVGAILVCIVALIYVAYTLGGWLVKEFKSMPLADPNEEIQVDVLRINKTDEKKALLMSDSLARTYNLDSIKRKVQIETIPVYRPPRRENKWYITKKEWRDIWQNIQIRKLEKKQEETQANDNKREANSTTNSN